MNDIRISPYRWARPGERLEMINVCASARHLWCFALWRSVVSFRAATLCFNAVNSCAVEDCHFDSGTLLVLLMVGEDYESRSPLWNPVTFWSFTSLRFERMMSLESGSAHRGDCHWFKDLTFLELMHIACHLFCQSFRWMMELRLFWSANNFTIMHDVTVML